MTVQNEFLYMLDTNTVSYILKNSMPAVRHHLIQVPISNLCISAITEAELLYGLAKKPKAKALHTVVQEFLLRVDVLPWDSAAANAYAQLRSQCEKDGTLLGNLDMLIAAHAMAAADVLVTNDQAFSRIEHGPHLADWTRES